MPLTWTTTTTTRPGFRTIDLGKQADPEVGSRTTRQWDEVQADLADQAERSRAVREDLAIRPEPNDGLTHHHPAYKVDVENKPGSGDYWAFDIVYAPDLKAATKKAEADVAASQLAGCAFRVEPADEMRGGERVPVRECPECGTRWDRSEAAYCPKGCGRGDADRNLIVATDVFADSEPKWDALRESGASDDRIREFLGLLWAGTPSGSGQDYDYATRGGRKPAIWFGPGRWEVKPTLANKALIEAVRRALRIPRPVEAPAEAMPAVEPTTNAAREEDFGWDCFRWTGSDRTGMSKEWLGRVHAPDADESWRRADLTIFKGQHDSGDLTIEPAFEGNDVLVARHGIRDWTVGRETFRVAAIWADQPAEDEDHQLVTLREAPAAEAPPAEPRTFDVRFTKEIRPGSWIDTPVGQVEAVNRDIALEAAKVKFAGTEVELFGGHKRPVEVEFLRVAPAEPAEVAGA